MSTKAVHIEVVHSLTTPAYIAALHRFGARRGSPAHIFSDQGTNYIGAGNHFRKLLTPENAEWMNYLTDRNMEFHPLPPTGPWLNGLVESAVKSAKSLMHRTIGTDVLTLEEFGTVVARVEAVLNSRPLTRASADPNDLRPITAGDLLIGRPQTSPLEEELELEQVPVRQRWRLVHAMAQRFWKRWQLEYLQSLQTREKWLQERESVKKGEIVLIYEPNSPPLTWKMGQIVETFPGKDNQIRVLDVRTKTGILRRPVARLYPLPITY